MSILLAFTGKFIHIVLVCVKLERIAISNMTYLFMFELEESRAAINTDCDFDKTELHICVDFNFIIFIL